MAEHARVLIVDDSRVFRAALAEALAGEDGIAVAGSVHSGERALEFLQAHPVDVVTLDVEMPGLDGLQTLEGIQRLNAGRPPGAEAGVIMVSAFTRRGADITVRALQAGAFDFVTKPSGPDENANQTNLRQQLACKIRLFLCSRRALARRAEPGAAAPVATPPPAGTKPPRVVLLAASTGGPRALEVLLPELRARTDLPVLLVQHMPSLFTQSLTEKLNRSTGGAVVEARDGDPLRPRTTYVAPGGKHLLVRQDGGRLWTGLNEQPPENGFRPSADVLFRSAAAGLNGAAVAVVLTGMGRDGTAGLRPFKRAGGYVIAQDEASSVVWGMPGSAVAAGLADAVLPLDRIAVAVQALTAERGNA
jgi:two-component system chemotaxis response regulator CheB